MKCCQLNTIYKGSKSAKAYYKPKHRTVKMWSLGENKKKKYSKNTKIIRATTIPFQV